VVTAWPDALRQVTATTRSGASVAKALEELAVSGPEALRPAMATFAVRAQVVGVSAALGLLRADLADPVTDRVVEILVPAHERGGSIVPQILDALAEATAADLRVVEELRAAGLEQRLNAHIVVAVPWVILALLTLRDGPYREFYGSPAGGWVIVTGLLLTLTGGFLVRRWGRVPTEPRVLRSSP
jgi:tight adherence protein B